ncbi:DMT family transporter [Haloferula sp. BvORR071]|uniref:DMT family transporter n=1 Tax=Haloferula sp. BvORR071 TaxID=1396141 RepID=UPI0005526F26|nr:DMT family transporter [Haloferula sp. BvORR071]
MNGAHRLSKVLPPVLLCALLWGSAFPGIKSVYLIWEKEGLHPTASDCWWFAGVRFTLAGLMLLLVARRPWAEFGATSKKALLGFGITQTFGQYLLFYLAISAASGSLAGLLSSLGSFWWMLLGPLVAGVAWPRPAQWLAIAVGGVGVAIAAGAESAGMGKNPWLGTLLLLGSTGLGTLGLVQFAALKKTIGARAATGFSLFGGGLGLLVAGAGSFPKAALLMPSAAMVTTFWLAFVSAAAFSLWNHLSTLHPMPLLAGYRFLIPLMATIESMLFLGERPGWRFAAGGVLILGSLVASQRLSREAATA